MRTLFFRPSKSSDHPAPTEPRNAHETARPSRCPAYAPRDANDAHAHRARIACPDSLSIVGLRKPSRAFHPSAAPYSPVSPCSRCARGQPSHRSFESHSKHDRVRAGSVRTRLSSLCTSGADLPLTPSARARVKAPHSFYMARRHASVEAVAQPVARAGLMGHIERSRFTGGDAIRLVPSPSFCKTRFSTPSREAAGPEG